VVLHRNIACERKVNRGEELVFDAARHMNDPDDLVRLRSWISNIRRFLILETRSHDLQDEDEDRPTGLINLSKPSGNYMYCTT
jgi:hypothetical protein